MRTVTSRLGRKYHVEPSPFNVDGGQGLLYHCVDVDRVDRVYKEYKTPVSASSEVDRLHRLAQSGWDAVRRAENGSGRTVRGGLATTAESSINWPIDVIHGRRGGVAGVVLPLIPQSFMLTQPNGRTTARTLDFLYLARAEPPPPMACVRLGVLLRVCDIFMELEDRRLTHGDLSAKNLVWRERDTHAYLIDCDGLTSWNDQPTHGVATQEWTDPRRVAGVIPAHDRFSDRFALALVLYRCLFLNPGGPRWPGAPQKGQWIKPTGFPGGLDPALRRMFSRALDDPFATGARPSAAEWHHALHTVFVIGGSRPSYREDKLRVLDEYAAQHRRGIQHQPTAQRRPAVQHQHAAPQTGQRPASGFPVQTPRPHPQRQPQVRPQTQVATTRTRQPIPQTAPRQRRQPPSPPPSPPARRRRRRTLVVLAMVVSAALAGAGVHLFLRDSAAPPDAGPLRAGAPCPTAVAARIPDGAGATLLHAYTTELHRITLCRTARGRIYYNGSWLDPDAARRKSGQITIPAEPTANGYRARNKDFLYVIRDEWVIVHPPDGEARKYRLTEVG
ncbi:hypothetical protein ACIP2X_10450 [Streptomyces sp. NPDC089424]|uniref:hypothetical protein n=1 Tax=Streptomyces sp. NPDC089424 TaxID=3365917 RepID=UPI00381B8755